MPDLSWGRIGYNGGVGAKKGTILLLAGAMVLAVAHLKVSSLPLGASTPLMALDALFALVLVFCLLLVSATIGLRLLRFLGLRQFAKRLERPLARSTPALPGADPVLPRKEMGAPAQAGTFLLFSTGLGLGVVAYVVLLAGMLGLLYPWLFLALGVVVLVLMRGELGEVREFLAAARQPSQLSRFEMLLFYMVVLFLALGLLATLGPVFDHDAQAYHLAFPKLYAQSYQITWSSDHISANFPASMEMLYTLGLVFGSDQFAKMLNFAFGLLAALGLYDLAAGRFGRGTGLLATLIFVSIPLVANAMGRAGVDLGLTFFEFLAVCAFLRWLSTRHPAWLLLSGAFGGLMAGTKYTGIQFMAIIVVVSVLALAVTRTKGIRNWLVSLALPSLAGGAVAAIWYLKNWFLFANPVYPFFFGGSEWDARRLQILHDSFEGYGFGHDLADYLTLIPNMIVYPGRFTLDPPGLVSALILLAPFAWLLVFTEPGGRPHPNPLPEGEGKNLPTLILTTICVLQFAFWAMGLQETRLLMSILPWLSLLAAVVVSRCLKSRWRSAIAATQVLTIMAVVPLLFFQLQQANVDGLRVIFGLESRRDYLTSRFAGYPTIEFMNSHLPADARVLFLWRNRGYYLERDYLADDAFSRFTILDKDVTSPAGVMERLKEMGVTHVLINRVDTAKWRADPSSVFYDDVGMLDKLAAEYLVPIYVDEQNEVLALKDDR